MRIENPYSVPESKPIIISAANIEQIINSIRYQQATRVPYTVINEALLKLNEQSSKKNT